MLHDQCKLTKGSFEGRQAKTSTSLRYICTQFLGAYHDHLHFFWKTFRTSFIEESVDSTVRWEKRKVKHQTTDKALKKTVEINACLKLDPPKRV